MDKNFKMLVALCEGHVKNCENGCYGWKIKKVTEGVFLEVECT
jgi:hypothetical protein